MSLAPCEVINLYAKGQFKIDMDRLGKIFFVIRFMGNHVKQIIINLTKITPNL